MLFRRNKNNKEFKRWHLILLALVIVAAVGHRFYLTRWPTALVRIGREQLKVLVASTQAHRVEGWSNKKDMGNYQGMLFVFPERSQHTMVMREMRFPLDIIWLDGLTIVDIAPNLAPEAGRAEADLTPYFARLLSTQVLELPAGFASQHGVKIGDEIEVRKY